MIINNKKPPIGAIPKWVWDNKCNEERYNELCRAISEYYNAGMEIRIEWIVEYNELIHKINIK